MIATVTLRSEPNSFNREVDGNDMCPEVWLLRRTCHGDRSNITSARARTGESFAYWRWRCSSHSFCNLSNRTDSRLLPLLPYILTVYQTQDSSQGHQIDIRREDSPVLAGDWCFKTAEAHFSSTSVGYGHRRRRRTKLPNEPLPLSLPERRPRNFRGTNAPL